MFGDGAVPHRVVGDQAVTGSFVHAPSQQQMDAPYAPVVQPLGMQALVEIRDRLFIHLGQTDLADTGRDVVFDQVPIASLSPGIPLAAVILEPAVAPASDCIFFSLHIVRLLRQRQQYHRRERIARGRIDNTAQYTWLNFQEKLMIVHFYKLFLHIEHLTNSRN